MAEYVPFGMNLMVELNQHMGSVERVSGGFYTASITDNEDCACSRGFHAAPAAAAATRRAAHHSVCTSVLSQPRSLKWTPA